ncbi:MAG: hypothetical protein KDD43_09235 [Bdellovibrionales bacterium]|nr:hypothetical protein [Bdellovibrionales bacterium]
MLSQAKIRYLFTRLNDELSQLGEIGEIGLVGGAVMCLVYNARESTKDVDAIFEPTKIIRRLAEKIGKQEGLPPTWLNDGAKGFIFPGFGREEILNLSHLRVWAPEPKYMLAMKCISARWDTSDRDDVVFLIKLLKLKKAKQVFDLIEAYYPKNKIPSKTQFFVDELFEL